MSMVSIIQPDKGTKVEAGVTKPKRNLAISHVAAFNDDIPLWKLPVTSPPHRTSLCVEHSVDATKPSLA